MKIVRFVGISVLALIGVIGLFACGGDEETTPAGGSGGTSGGESGIWTVKIYFRNGYGYSNPYMWFWKDGGSGEDVAPSGTQTVNGYEFVVFQVSITDTGKYYFKFKDGSGTSANWEQCGTQGPANRNFTVSSNSPSTVEYYAISYNRRVFDSSLATILSNPPSASVTNRFGAWIDGSYVNFCLFAPNSASVYVAGEFNSWNSSANPMYLTPDGKFWWARINIPSADGTDYKYILDGNTWIVDPYTKAVHYDGGYANGVIKATNTFSWTDSGWSRPDISELVIYELHVHDFTADSSSGVGAGHNGKYLGIIDKISYLTNLGINAVEFMPVHEFHDAGFYSWGYSPTYFMAPEGSFASSTGGAQVDEFKQMVNALHNAGIAVIVDSVFNHIANDENVWWTVDSVYYFDYNNNGSVENSGEDKTDWGNHFVTWRPMVKELMYQYMKYWIEEFHVDGFRFDATWYVDHDALKEVINRIKAEHPNIYFIAEQLPNSADFKGTGIAQWGAVFHDKMKAMIRQGDFEGEHYDNVDRVAMIVYYSRDEGCFANPREVVNYLESHDESTVAYEASTGSGVNITNATRMAAVVLFTSMGIPMMYEGQEFLRSKQSQDTDEADNRIYWTQLNSQVSNEVWEYYKGLINLRKNHPALRMTSSDPASEGKFRWSVVPSTWGDLGYAVKKEASGKVLGWQLNVNGSISDNKFVVVVNFDTVDKNGLWIQFPESGTWKLVANGTNVNESGITTITVGTELSNQYDVKARSGYIFMK